MLTAQLGPPLLGTRPDGERWNPMGDKSEKSKNKTKKQGEAQKQRDQANAAAKRVPPPSSPAKKK
jgi:hypothetical protein